MKIAFCASEAVPFAKTGGLADVTGALPLALEELGHEVILIMPCYKQVRDAKAAIRRLKPDIVSSVIGEGVRAYFIEDDFYFGRESLYGDKTGDYKDNLKRFSYYCKRSIDLLKELDFSPDIIHCHDWQSALVPVYMKTLYSADPFYNAARTVFTIHNIGYQGLFPREEFADLGIDWKYFDVETLEFFGRINLLKGGIVFSDIINTVSPTYSKEIQTSEFGFGLEGVLAKRRKRLFGVLNGLDYSIWDPGADKIIASDYTASDLRGKSEDKKQLQEICGLPLNKDVPLVGIVSRLAEQKGFDLLSQAMDVICKMNLQIVILGTGDAEYHKLLSGIAAKYPKVMSLHLKFDDVLAHKIYAGSDIFLMPSKYEPCGLGQLISLRYGTIPVVFKTGGLADTVTPKCGFIFQRYKKDDLINSLKDALKAFSAKDKWNKLIASAMQCDFSWEESARKYARLYEEAGKVE
ncbi:MAG: glycogen synthase GlgA [Candidatus Omnitrophota bacterium]